MHALPRLSTSVIGASAVTLGLFFLMQLLISSNYIIPEEVPSKPPIFYPKVAPVDPPPPPPDEPSEWVENTSPDLPIYETTFPSKPATPDKPDFGLFGTGSGTDGGTGGSINFGDSEAIRIVQAYTMYPTAAEQRGIEGSALVEFTVSAKGTVVDAILIEETPESYGFGRAALQALVKFKFRPRIVDGEAVTTPGMRERFQFEMPDE